MNDDGLLWLEEMALLSALDGHPHLSAAAQALKMPAATLRRRVAALERHVGAALVVRRGAALVLSDHARALNSALADMQTHAARAAASAADDTREIEGEVHVAMSPLIACGWVAPQLPVFQRRHPRLRLRLSLCEYDSPLREQGPELVLGMRGDLDPDSVAVPLLTHSFTCCAAPAYWRNRPGQPQPREPEDLQALDWIASAACDRAEPLRRYELQRVAGTEARLIELRPRLVLSEARDVLSAVEAGLGLAIVSRRLLALPRLAGRVQAVLPEWQMNLGTGAVTLYLVARPYAALSRGARALMAFLKALDWAAPC
jgi:DNA-binding transcriptional LysR family regulator